MATAELWIRLNDGRTLRERYNQIAMAEFIREAMIDCLERGAPLHCFDGDHVQVPAELVRGIELVVAHESRRAVATSSS
jgi:hypothetical protein